MTDGQLMWILFAIGFDTMLIGNCINKSTEKIVRAIKENKK